MVTSVAELEGHIDQLSADIARQKEVLKNLEQRKSAAQRQLNALRDPVACLPVDISSEIFIQCLIPSSSAPRAQHAPLLLLDVCNAWTNIALSTPALWAVIHLAQPMSNPESLLCTWLERAGNRALSISLPTPLSTDIAAAIGSHVHQLQDLRIFHDEHDIRIIAAEGPFLFLKRLTLIGVSSDSFFNSRVSDTLRIFCSCPNLVECILNNTYCRPDNRAEMLVLPYIQHFHFGIAQSPGDLCFLNNTWSSAYVLRHLSLPHLQTLFLPFLNIEIHELSQFFQRSSPPLQKLVFGNTAGVNWTLHGLEKCLSLLPTLTHFELSPPEDEAVDYFLTILASSPHLLPNLTSFIFRSFRPPEPWDQKLLSALWARRKQLYCVRIIGGDELLMIAAPSEDVTIQLRELVADGMKIHIGTEKRNYI